MRTTFDFSPYTRSSIGFDRVFDRLQNAGRVETIDNWPPYDIIKTGEDSYSVVMAVAGFTAADLDLVFEPGLLIVSGTKADKRAGEYIHQGIAGRGFQQRFELDDHVEVEAANLENGLLRIELRRRVPDQKRPRNVAIRSVPRTEVVGRPDQARVA